MIRTMLFFFLICGGLKSFAQMVTPVQWNFSATKIAANTYEVHLTANLDGKWHIYSQSTPEGGPVATSFSFLKNPLLALDGSIRERGEIETHFEPLFGVEVKQFSNKVDFVQRVRLRSKAKTALSGAIEFMACNDKECLPPRTIKFSIPLK